MRGAREERSWREKSGRRVRLSTYVVRSRRLEGSVWRQKVIEGAVSLKVKGISGEVVSKRPGWGRKVQATLPRGRGSLDKHEMSIRKDFPIEIPFTDVFDSKTLSVAGGV